MEQDARAKAAPAEIPEEPIAELELQLPRMKLELPAGDPAGLIDMVAPLVAHVEDSTEAGSAFNEFIVEPPSDFSHSGVIFESIIQADEAEEQIGSAVLDVCLEAQQAITDRLDLVEEQPPILRHRMDGVSRITRFDVVQPEAEIDSVPQPEGRRRPSGAVPPPNYKNLFSMLRRRQKNARSS
jgi:hypothetical protein